MLKQLHDRRPTQLVLGLCMGVIFGILLEKGGVADYDVIIGQLLLEDFTVVKIMLSAVVTGMIGIHALRSLGLAQLHPKPGSVGTTVVGGLIFGVAFGVLGYCPGIVLAAIGQGSLDALLGGVIGILLGAGIFAAAYPRLADTVLSKGDFGNVTLPELLRVNAWVVVVPLAVALVGLLMWVESAWPWVPAGASIGGP